jgi:hypothetical protein
VRTILRMQSRSPHWADQESAAEATYGGTVVPEARRLEEAIGDLDARRDELGQARGERDAVATAVRKALVFVLLNLRGRR